MDQNTRLKLTLKTSIVACAALGAFWGIWYAIAGTVPKSLAIDLGTYGSLPTISRLWDVAAAPLWVYLLFRVYTSEKLRDGYSGDNSAIVPFLFVSSGVAMIFILALFGRMLAGHQDQDNTSINVIKIATIYSGISGLLFGIAAAAGRSVVASFVAAMSVPLALAVLMALLFGTLLGGVVLVAEIAPVLAVFVFSVSYRWITT